MAFTQAPSSNPSKRIKLTIISPRQLFINLSSDKDATTTPFSITTSSSSSPPIAPSKTSSTKDTSSTFGATSSSFKSKPQSLPLTSNDTPSPQPSNTFLDNIMDAPLRPSHLILMQKRKNDVKARTTLLLALLDEHQLRFNKNETAQKLWAAILKTFGGNEATKKTKKNLLKQQYGNFKVEGLETLEQTFNRLQVYESEVQKKSELNS
nr:hypothetical protein [Tanacetum cinerariifolium]